MKSAKQQSPGPLVEVTANGDVIALAAPATLADLVGHLALTGRRFALELNGRVVPKTQHAETPLAAGDRVEIVHAVGGG